MILDSILNTFSSVFFTVFFPKSVLNGILLFHYFPVAACRQERRRRDHVRILQLHRERAYLLSIREVLCMGGVCTLRWNLPRLLPRWVGSKQDDVCK